MQKKLNNDKKYKIKIKVPSKKVFDLVSKESSSFLFVSSFEYSI